MKLLNIQSLVFLCCHWLHRYLMPLIGGGVPKRRLGKTGEMVSMLCLGGHHVGRMEDENGAIRLMRTAVDEGVTFFDNAWHYHDGYAEEIMGRGLRDGYRKKVFLMTKHHGRDKKTALEHLDTNLRRLQTDYLDLWQFHEINDPDDPKKIFAPDGSIEAAIEAKKSGKVRYVGFTGHRDPDVFLDMLSYDYEWDTVQMPINPFDPHYKSYEKTILPILLERDIGVLAMKTMGGGRILNPGVHTVEEGLRYVWSKPVSTIVSGMANIEHLKFNIHAARNFKAMTDEEEQNLLTRTEQSGKRGTYEYYKIQQS